MRRLIKSSNLLPLCSSLSHLTQQGMTDRIPDDLFYLGLRTQKKGKNHGLRHTTGALGKRVALGGAVGGVPCGTSACCGTSEWTICYMYTPLALCAFGVGLTTYTIGCMYTPPALCA